MSTEQGQVGWTHELKCCPPYFEEVLSGRKTFEARSIADRHFEVGDTLVLREFDYSLLRREPETEGYTGRTCERLVTYLLGDGSYGIKFGHVVMALAAPHQHPPEKGQVGAEALAGPIKHLERIRDLDEQTSDGSLGSLARRALDELAALPQQQPSVSRGEAERLELIATRIGEEFDAETPPHEKARDDIAFLRSLAKGLEGQGEAGEYDQLEGWKKRALKAERRVMQVVGEHERLKARVEGAAYYASTQPVEGQGEGTGLPDCADCGRHATSEQELDGWGSNGVAHWCFACCMERQRQEELGEKLTEFDAWLSSRGEFGEALTAFRDAFGTDTSAAATESSPPQPAEGQGEAGRLQEAESIIRECESPDGFCGEMPDDLRDRVEAFNATSTQPAVPSDLSGDGEPREELTMIALALKNHGIEGCTPEEGVERLIQQSYLRRIVVAPGDGEAGLREALEAILRHPRNTGFVSPGLREAYDELTAALDANPPVPSEDSIREKLLGEDVVRAAAEAMRTAPITTVVEEKSKLLPSYAGETTWAELAEIALRAAGAALQPDQEDPGQEDSDA